MNQLADSHSDAVLERLRTEAQLAKNGDKPILERSFDLAINEIQRLRAALQEISEQHVPDQPAAYGMSERDWAYRHVGTLRHLALKALKGSQQ